MIRGTSRNLSSLIGKTSFAVVLGSGLSAMEEETNSIETVHYGDIPGLRTPSVEGHPGRLSLCSVRGSYFLLFAGRFHLYEGLRFEEVGGVVSLAKELGCTRVLLAHAAGSLNRNLPVGVWMLPSDIVSIPSRSFIAGCRSSSGQRGKSVKSRDSMRSLISGSLREEISSSARETGIALYEGVLFWTTGPNYETAAEARFAVEMGADAAAMSSFPELAVARSSGIESAVLSWITNHTANVTGGATDHAEVVRMGEAGAAGLLKIVEKLAARHYSC